MTTNYDGFLIRKFGRGFAVYDWDYEWEALIFVAPTMTAARAWIDRRNA